MKALNLNNEVGATHFWDTVNDLFAKLSHLIAHEFWFEDRLNQYNHLPHFPHYTTLQCDSMPIATTHLSELNYNPKYADVWGLKHQIFCSIYLLIILGAISSNMSLLLSLKKAFGN